jgi:hypothetical protein
MCSAIAPVEANEGTTSHCCEWHIVGYEEDCDAIEETFNLSEGQFKELNRNIDDGCYNLAVGWA